MVPEVRFLNLDYLFNKFFESFGLLAKLILELIAFLARYYLISFFISVILMAAIVVFVSRTSALRRKRLIHLVEPSVKEEIPKERKNKWDEIQRKINSENLSDWASALKEADSLLEEIITSIGYKGENFEEKLKLIEPSDFDNLKNVWEAHQFRNKIEIEGEKFIFTKEEAREVLEKYQKALKELKYI